MCKLKVILLYTYDVIMRRMIVELVERGVLGVRLVRHSETVSLVHEGFAVVVAYVDSRGVDRDRWLNRLEEPWQRIAVSRKADYHVRAFANPVNHQLLMRVVQGVHL